MSWISSLWIVWFAHFVVDLFVGIWPAYKTLAHLDLAQAGLIMGISGFIGDGSQMFVGFLGDKGHRKKLLLLGIVLVMSSALLSYTQELPLLFILMLLTYLGSGFFHPSAAGIVQNLNLEKRGFSMAVFASGGTVGLAVTQMLFAYLYFAFEGETLVLLGFTVLALFLLRYVKVTQLRVPVRGFSLKKIFEPFGVEKKALSLLYFSQLFQQIVMYGFIFLLPDVLRSQGQADWICFGGGHCLFVIGAAMMLIPAGILADRFGQKRILMVSISVSFVLFYVFLSQLVMHPWMLGVLLLAFGACMGTYNPIGISLGNKLLPQYSSSVSALLMGCVWCMAHVFGSAGSGFIAQFFTEGAPIKALLCMGALLPISIALTWLVPVESVEPEVEEKLGLELMP